MLQYLKRVIRGQVKHWADHHNPVVNELWNRALVLPEAPQAIYKELVLCSSGIIEALVGMNRSGKQLSYAVDCRTINQSGYRQLYALLLGYFVFLLILLNPSLRQGLLDSLDVVCGDSEEQKRLLEKLQRVQALLPKQDGGRPDLAKLGGELWQELKPVLNAGDDPLYAVQFTLFATDVFNVSLRELKTSLSSPKS